ncbi:hypothetical protein glysoja_048948 [Glycine soja]|uniref:J domain-containing protein n=1 Tax=Glycine soja TaxID=3848 RepID=A0A0B2SDV9_GLYSO|nr:hypothetical protein glysoja_048948 [Glycine soja]
MLLDKNDIQETHYEVLHVKEHANYEEIRAGYRSVVLSLHPDRLLKTSKTSSSNKAWEILCNSSSRSFYDNELRSSRKDVLAAYIAEDLSLRKDVLAADVAEDLSLQDMMIEDDGEALELFYQCRCGDYFSVDSWN